MGSPALTIKGKWAASIEAWCTDAETKHGLVESIIPDGLTFVDWCEQLGRDGMCVDGKPFRLDNRPALRFVYELIPSAREEAHFFKIAVMKGAQTGLTVWEMLVAIWCALKFYPCSVGSYVPDMKLAAYKSTERFMPIVRKVPAAYERLREEAAQRGSAASKEGNVLTRSIGASKILFLWTSGSVSTESFPLDVVNFDEVQQMTIADIEKTEERLSASDIKMKLFLSTAMYPDADIDYLFKRGNRYRFHTRCACSGGVVLDEAFPTCVVYNSGQFPDAPLDEYVYCCPTCKQYIPDSQEGAWVKEMPDAGYHSLHVPQTLSPTVSAREMYESFVNARDLENFYRRKLGRPFIDPSRIPVTIEMLEACAAEGVRRGVVWKQTATGTFMGIDQMGAFNVVIIKERMKDGRRATIHVEMIYDNNPFARCDDLMEAYGVVVCCVETLPNYNDAKRFAQRHKGKVFLANYGDIQDEMLRWGDSNLTTIERKTSATERDHFTVTLDQYKCMQVSMKLFAEIKSLFPDPAGRIQEVRENGVRQTVEVLRKIAFVHFTKTALVAELVNEEEKKYRRKVVKVGIDPHFSYANMLCDVAFARAHGTSSFIFPEVEVKSSILDNGVNPLPVKLDSLPPGVVCGRCSAFKHEQSFCEERLLTVRPQDPGCPFHSPRSHDPQG